MTIPSRHKFEAQRRSEVWIGSVRLFVAPKEWPPFLADALAEEEDTYLVLSADPEVQETREQPEELMAELLKTKPAVPGSVIVKEGRPLSLLAIVHDLEPGAILERRMDRQCSGRNLPGSGESKAPVDRPSAAGHLTWFIG